MVFRVTTLLFQMSRFHSKLWYKREARRYGSYTEKKAFGINYARGNPNIGFTKDFKSTIINMYEELKENMSKHVERVKYENNVC